MNEDKKLVLYEGDAETVLNSGEKVTPVQAHTARKMINHNKKIESILTNLRRTRPELSEDQRRELAKILIRVG